MNTHWWLLAVCFCLSCGASRSHHAESANSATEAANAPKLEPEIEVPPGMWESCRGTKVFSEYRLQCDQATQLNFITAPRGEHINDKVLDETIGTMFDRLKSDRTVSLEEYEDIRLPIPFNHRARSIYGPGQYALVAIWFGEGETVELAQCVENREGGKERCLALITDYAKHGLPDNLASLQTQTPPIYFGKQRVRIPEGCEATGTGAVKCPSGDLVWFDEEPNMPGSHKLHLDWVKRINLAGRGEPKRRMTLDCWIGGRKTKCEHWDYSTDEKPLYLVTAMLDERSTKTRVGLFCKRTVPLDDDTPDPMPCSILISHSSGQ